MAFWDQFEGGTPVEIVTAFATILEDIADIPDSDVDSMFPIVNPLKFILYTRNELVEMRVSGMLDSFQTIFRDKRPLSKKIPSITLFAQMIERIPRDLNDPELDHLAKVIHLAQPLAIAALADNALDDFVLGSQRFEVLLRFLCESHRKRRWEADSVKLLAVEQLDCILGACHTRLSKLFRLTEQAQKPGYVVWPAPEPTDATTRGTTATPAPTATAQTASAKPVPVGPAAPVTAPPPQMASQPPQAFDIPAATVYVPSSCAEPAYARILEAQRAAMDKTTAVPTAAPKPVPPVQPEAAAAPPPQQKKKQEQQQASKKSASAAPAKEEQTHKFDDLLTRSFEEMEFILTRMEWLFAVPCYLDRDFPEDCEAKIVTNKFHLITEAHWAETLQCNCTSCARAITHQLVAEQQLLKLAMEECSFGALVRCIWYFFKWYAETVECTTELMYCESEYDPLALLAKFICILWTATVAVHRPDPMVINALLGLIGVNRMLLIRLETTGPARFHESLSIPEDPRMRTDRVNLIFWYLAQVLSYALHTYPESLDAPYTEPVHRLMQHVADFMPRLKTRVGTARTDVMSVQSTWAKFLGVCCLTCTPTAEYDPFGEMLERKALKKLHKLHRPWIDPAVNTTLLRVVLIQQQRPAFFKNFFAKQPILYTLYDPQCKVQMYFVESLQRTGCWKPHEVEVAATTRIILTPKVLAVKQKEFEERLRAARIAQHKANPSVPLDESPIPTLPMTRVHYLVPTEVVPKEAERPIRSPCERLHSQFFYPSEEEEGEDDNDGDDGMEKDDVKEVDKKDAPT
eukprot:TRINITY_DN11441_c0_g1_i1.p1 TRINITY_DN11441_c0_g1~~TRINITY_DN11441_c0_g1_i1.p1  ORF type:complete len:802 (-),score=127.46 TRINITY_DN11441_c0_g1_i1:128-2533(-)